jgi:hypothetical protein
MDRAVDVLSRRVVGLHANPYNGSDQYSYTAKHKPLVFFTAANAGNHPTPSNPEAAHYAPMQQLATDLTNDTVARYTCTTPNQYNDMHSAPALPLHLQWRPLHGRRGADRARRQLPLANRAANRIFSSLQALPVRKLRIVSSSRMRATVCPAGRVSK